MFSHRMLRKSRILSRHQYIVIWLRWWVLLKRWSWDLRNMCRTLRVLVIYSIIHVLIVILLIISIQFFHSSIKSNWVHLPWINFFLLKVEKAMERGVEWSQYERFCWHISQFIVKCRIKMTLSYICSPKWRTYWIINLRIIDTRFSKQTVKIMMHCWHLLSIKYILRWAISPPIWW